MQAETACFAKSLRLCAILTVSLFFCGCQQNKSVSSLPVAQSAITLQSVDVNDSDLPTNVEPAPAISAAKNEWVSFAVRLDHLPAGGSSLSLRVTCSPAIPALRLSAFQALPTPVDTNLAGYVRQTGLSTGTQNLPRALLPVPSDNGIVDISNLRDPSHPSDPSGRLASDGTAIVWFDLHIPADGAAGDYALRCDILSTGVQPLATLAGSLHVYDFAIPPERNLTMVSSIDWDRLQQLYPDAFEAITPRLVNRGDDKYAACIAVMDQLEQLAAQNRTEVVIPRLQPTVKWSIADRPLIDWSDFDSVVAPWLDGDGLPDKSPLGFWPIPREDYLDNYDPNSQREYWSNASTHFNRMDWLGRSAVVLTKRSPGRATALESIQLSMAARMILESHPLTHIMLPLEEDQIQFESADNPALLPISMASRLIALSPGLVFGSPTQNWPQDAPRPKQWMMTDSEGLVPYLGAGTDQRDVRLWAWLAYLRHADLIQWSAALPEQNDPNAPADPGKLTWFYPGSWFGIDGPVPTMQLKWLRRAEQDYEYLILAEQRGMRTNGYLLARLLTRQVELQPTQSPDPEFALLTGTIDQKTWDEAQDLLARSILARPPGSSPDDPAVKSAGQQLDLDLIRWQTPKERPYVLPRSAQWMWDDPTQSNGDPWAFLRLGVDIYNAADSRPEDNQLQWLGAGDGWEFKPEPSAIGSLRTYWVQRFAMTARVNLSKIDSTSRQPISLTFVDGYTKAAYPAQAMLPVATSVRREGDLRIDGKLNDWADEDLIQDGPLAKMVDRPSIQHWRLDPSSQSSRIYTGWGEDNFYVAFRVAGVSDRETLHRNFVDYQFRRAWGEDLCQVLIQPIYDDSSVGPVTYLACKPNGVCMVRRRLDPRTNTDPWRETDGTAVRYAADDPQPGTWTGELAIPWRLLLNDHQGRPRLLRFNFVQHFQSSGESASWAGPIDFDQDDQFMGLLYLRDFTNPGLRAGP
jgi:hypothetical protein